MSDYMERSLEAAYVSDESWGSFAGYAHDAARIFSAVTISIAVFASDTVQAADESQGRGYVVAESVAHVGDEVLNQRYSLARSTDLVRVRDQIKAGGLYVAEDELQVGDSVRVGILARINDRAYITDQTGFNRVSLVRSQDILKISDRSYARFIAQHEDQLHISDAVAARQHIHAYSTDILNISDEDFSSVQANSRTNDRIRVTDAVWASLQVTARNEDVLFIYDEYPRELVRAQAWVANVSRFAMSRYDPFNFDGLTVINGQLYGWNDQGVFLCGVEGEQIQATLETGKLDFSESLVHPLAYFMEYQLRGESKAIAVTVGTTQSGNLQQYTYNLPAENANELTNGRVQFGRGLRGRHFSFKIQLQGTAATLNAQSVDFSPTSRRI